MCVTAGYGDVACKSCIAGYYRLQEQCVKCPSTAYMLIFMYAVVIGRWLVVALWPCGPVVLSSCRPVVLCPGVLVSYATVFLSWRFTILQV